MKFSFVVSSAPGIAAAIALAISDVLAKIIIEAHCGVLTMLSFRSVIGFVFLTVWLRLGPRAPTNARIRWVSLGVGVVFAALTFCLFKAIEANDVATAILTYFVYPLLTGLVASASGLERLSWRGVVCALIAFLGLAVMIGAHPAGLALAGIAYALGAAGCRTAVLIASRAFLADADARLTTWYSVIAQLVIFVAVSVATRTWNPPQTAGGWVALVAMSLATTAAILLMFVSTIRIGPFRTALIMNLEPFTAMVLSALMLGESVTLLEAAGSAVMLAALLAFQLWK
ncbi:MAG: DMT family transporter [Hyphomicrobiales bacterium]|nr:DMT family transporter [Hyphomicrobiales bacterium]MDE2374222.1 DMT family transporter [Hyphomicrobiales bacterium]